MDRHRSTVAVMLVALGLIAFVAMPFAFGLSSARDRVPDRADRQGSAVDKGGDKEPAQCDRKAGKNKADRGARQKNRSAVCRGERREVDRRPDRGPREGPPPGWARRAWALTNRAPGMAGLFERCSADATPRRCLWDALKQGGNRPWWWPPTERAPNDQSPTPSPPTPAEPSPVVPSPSPS